VFLAACRVVDVLLAAKRRRIALAQAAQLLREANTEYITKHKAMYGSQHIKPKTHWLYDIADQMGLAAEERGEEAVLLDALVVERIHLDIKMYAEVVKHHKNFERAVLERATAHKLSRLEKAAPNALHDHLVGPLTQLSPTLPLTARACEIATCTYARGDVVLGNASDGTEGAIIIACTIQAGQVYLICEQHLRAYSRASVLLDTSNVRRNVWCARSCRPALVWYMVRADRMVAILAF
jgi:hypothetical protein